MNDLVTSEKEADFAYARAWNRLDWSEFIETLAEGAHYASQYVFEELTSKGVTSEYIFRKMQAVKTLGSKVYAELGRTRSGCSGRDCTFLCWGSKEEIQAVILFEISDSHIIRYDLIMPELVNVERSGVYPI
ncbi:MAG: hypothetical protein R8M38_02640 [Mariprofundaceae bacterium]